MGAARNRRNLRAVVKGAEDNAWEIYRRMEYVIEMYQQFDRDTPEEVAVIANCAIALKDLIYEYYHSI